MYSSKSYCKIGWIINGNELRIESPWLVEEFIFFHILLVLSIRVGKRFGEYSILKLLGKVFYEIYLWQYIGFQLLRLVPVDASIKASLHSFVVFTFILIVFGVFVAVVIEDRVNGFVLDTIAVR